LKNKAHANPGITITGVWSAFIVIWKRIEYNDELEEKTPASKRIPPVDFGRF